MCAADLSAPTLMTGADLPPGVLVADRGPVFLLLLRRIRHRSRLVTESTPGQALIARDVHVAIGGRPTATDVDLDVGTGEIVALVGPNGCGKSTLFSGLAGLRPLAEGSVTEAGADLGSRPRCSVRCTNIRADMDPPGHWPVPRGPGSNCPGSGHPGSNKRIGGVHPSSAPPIRLGI